MAIRFRGFTIVEVLVSIFIMGILMTIFAQIATRYAMVVRHQESKDRSLANIRMALDTVTSELQEATSVITPGTCGETQTQVVFERYDPESTAQKFASRTLIRIRYVLRSGTLYREVTPPSSPAVIYPVAHSIAGFSVKRESDCLFSVNVAFAESHRVFTIVGKACMRYGY